MSVLDDLGTRGLIEAVEVDHEVANQWLDDARRHLEAARAIANLDPSGAYVLATTQPASLSPPPSSKLDTE